MAVFSDVTLVIERGFLERVKKKANDDVISLLNYADFIKGDEKSVRYDWKETKWYEDFDGTDNQQLQDLLEELDEDGDFYRIWKVTSDYMWEEYAPLDTWGSYRSSELDSKIKLGIEPYYGQLDKPYTLEEVLLIKNDTNYIKGLVEVTMDEMLSYSTSEFHEVISVRLLGKNNRLLETKYTIVDFDKYRNSVILEVSGDITEYLKKKAELLAV